VYKRRRLNDGTPHRIISQGEQHAFDGLNTAGERKEPVGVESKPPSQRTSKLERTHSTAGDKKPQKSILKNSGATIKESESAPSATSNKPDPLAPVPVRKDISFADNNLLSQPTQNLTVPPPTVRRAIRKTGSEEIIG